MVFANHGFWTSNDMHYQNLMANPVAEMKRRKLDDKCSSSLLDLIIGMLQADAQKRITIEQIKMHPWLQESCASQEEV